MTALCLRPRSSYPECPRYGRGTGNLSALGDLEKELELAKDTATFDNRIAAKDSIQ